MKQVMEARADRPVGRHAAPAALAGCPACGAVVRGDVAWCLRCYGDLRPPGDGPGPMRDHRGPHAGDETPNEQTPDDEMPDDPAAAGGQLDEQQAAALADRMVAELAAAERARPTWLDRRPRNPVASIGWGVAGLAVLSGLLLLLGAVVGRVL
jgi:hypothetical protein